MNEWMRNYVNLTRLNKPVGIFLLLWPTWWALWLAQRGMPDIKLLVIFTVGVVIMRTAGCIINDIADRKVDGLVERTQERPLATKKISVQQALILFSGLLIIAFMLVLMLNAFTISLAFVGLALAVLYPFLKRWTHLPQLGLGLAFSWGIPMVFAATMNYISCEAWLLFTAAVIWPVIYDTMYAMVDKKFDEKIGVKSTAVLFGKNVGHFVGILQGLFVAVLILVGIVFHLNIYYFLSLIVVSSLFIYQQVLIKDYVPQRCFQAFLNNNWVGLVVLIGIILGLTEG